MTDGNSDDRQPFAFNPGEPRSRKRMELVGFVAASFWIALLIVGAQTAEGLTLGWVIRVTLVIAAITVPMIFVPERELIRSRRTTSGIVGTELAYVAAGLLYLLAIGALFALLETFW